MIYGNDINKVCALCVYAEKNGEETVVCTRKKTREKQINDTCRHFKYDILKREVHRRRAFSTNLTPEDFEL